MRQRDLKIMDTLFWVKFAWAVWDEIRSARIPGLDLPLLPLAGEDSTPYAEELIPVKVRTPDSR